jgi:hypothetical protein
MNRAPSKESEEEEILPLGDEDGFRGEPPSGPGVRGVGFSGPSVGPEPLSTALPQEGQKRAAPATSLPQAGQIMVVAEYITARFQAPTLAVRRRCDVVGIFIVRCGCRGVWRC